MYNWILASWKLDLVAGISTWCKEVQIPLWILEVAESRRGGPAGEEEEAERGGLGLAGGVCRTCILHVGAGAL